MDQELKAYLDERFGRIDERFENVETSVRHTQILVEGVRSDLRLVAEGVMGFSERLEAFQSENLRRFDEIRALLTPVHQTLFGRIQSVDFDVQNLDRRVKILEGRADRQTGDVIEAIRQKFGKPRD